MQSNRKRERENEKKREKKGKEKKRKREKERKEKTFKKETKKGKKNKNMKNKTLIFSKKKKKNTKQSNDYCGVTAAWRHLLQNLSKSRCDCISRSANNLCKCCGECMQTDVPYTYLFCARRKGLQNRMTHVHTACSQGRKTDRLIYTSRFVRVIYSSCIVLIKPGTVTHLHRRGLRVHVR